MNESNQWFSIGEAAKYLRISKDTLRRWEKQKIIKSYRSPTNRRYFQKGDLNYVFSQKPELKEEPPKEESSLPPKKENRLNLVTIILLSICIILMIFLAWILLRAGQ